VLWRREQRAQARCAPQLARLLNKQRSGRRLSASGAGTAAAAPAREPFAMRACTLACAALHTYLAHIDMQQWCKQRARAGAVHSSKRARCTRCTLARPLALMRCGTHWAALPCLCPPHSGAPLGTHACMHVPRARLPSTLHASTR